MPEARYELFQDIAKKYRFRLVAPNNRIVAVSEAYETKASCLNGINAVMSYATSPIQDLTGDAPSAIPHIGHEMHLCKLVETGEASLSKIKDLVRNAEFVCSTCGRIAASSDNLCDPAPLND